MKFPGRYSDDRSTNHIQRTDRPMNQLDLIPWLLQIIGSVLALLTLLLGWIGVRIHNRLDDIGRSLSSIEKDLREDLATLDRRVTRVEAFSHSHHDSKQGIE